MGRVYGHGHGQMVNCIMRLFKSYSYTYLIIIHHVTSSTLSTCTSQDFPHCLLIPSHLQILYWCLPLFRTASIPLHVLFRRSLIRLEMLDFCRIHLLHHLIRLPLLETKAYALVGVVFVIGLIFVVLHLDEVTVDGGGVEGKGD